MRSQDLFHQICGRNCLLTRFSSRTTVFKLAPNWDTYSNLHPESVEREGYHVYGHVTILHI